MESNNPPQPLPWSLLSLPEDIVLLCLARISRSYYPNLCLVSKSFRLLVLSLELVKVREQLQTQEECIYLCLRSPTFPCLEWFSLWTEPDHQTLTQRTIQDTSTRNLLIPAPSSYSPAILPKVISERVGSDLYKIGQVYSPSYSSAVSIYNELTCQKRQAPSMMVARKEPLTCVLDGKIYVMGGCRRHESKYWAEVFDPKSQTWEPLPDPGPVVRFSSNKKLIPVPVLGEIVVKSKKKNFVYLLKDKKWGVTTNWESCIYSVDETVCVIESVKYCYAQKKCLWYETRSKEWRFVKGLTGLDAYQKNDTEIGSYGGKLVIFWDSPELSPLDQTKRIWCAMILLDKRIQGQVSGQIEWVNVVRTVPESYTLRRCMILVL